jgi:hypothetical protein
MTEYESGLPVTVAFAPDNVRRGLSEYLGEKGLGQLKVAETEKYAHVTYFFNGGEEKPFPGEDRTLIPSPKVPTYDLQPEMSAAGVEEAVADGLRSGRYHFILVNFANPDMVGHTGSIPAAVEGGRGRGRHPRQAARPGRRASRVGGARHRGPRKRREDADPGGGALHRAHHGAGRLPRLRWWRRGGSSAPRARAAGRCGAYGARVSGARSAGAR